MKFKSKTTILLYSTHTKEEHRLALTLLFINCVIWGNLLHFFEPQTSF